MGDPTHFSVKGGANPHTRTKWGLRRRVNRKRAIRQWHGLRDLLRDHGLVVLVVPPLRAQPGLVYPANAGFMNDIDTPLPIDRRRFTLANLLPTRAGEKPHYMQVLALAGFPLAEIDESYRFEGEADFFPAGDAHVFTFGTLERQRFVPALAFPPWKRVYGFRSDARVEERLAPMVAPRPILRVELTLEAHYHGDTVLCAFGPGRRFLLGYRDGIAAAGWELLRGHFGDDLIELDAGDAARYAANSFTFTQNGESHLVLPDGVSERLLAQIRERNVTPLSIDVSEFLKKGGGSVKCMIGDLGVISDAG